MNIFSKDSVIAVLTVAAIVIIGILFVEMIGQCWDEQAKIEQRLQDIFFEWRENQLGRNRFKGE